MTTDEIARVRRFTRFYTRQIDLLNEGLLATSLTLAEARVLYELAQREAVTASELGRELGIDAGYLSRILRKFEDAGWLGRTVSEEDGRKAHLRLTKEGAAAFRPMDEASDRQVAAMLEPLSGPARRRLVDAMADIQRLLSKGAAEKPVVRLRPPRIGDMGWIAHRQGILYAEEYGWDATYEALVAEIVATFVRNYDPERERCWIAEVDGAAVGSVFCVRESDDTAKLRLLYVEPDARGLGVGRMLVEACIAFARERGYRTLTLWTNDILTAARRIYLSLGFELTEEERHRSFGADLVGQNWRLDLA